MIGDRPDGNAELGSSESAMQLWKVGQVLAFWVLAGSSPAALAQTVVTVGTASSISDAPLFIADKLGYFREEGISATMTAFQSAAQMVAPLGAGQLDVGAGSASAGLYNAVSRDIKIRIVADKASSTPGYGGTKFLVRKDHVDSGRYKSPKDLKGLKVAMNAPGVSNTSTLNTILTSVGLKYSDVDTVNLPFPEHVNALRNKAVDAAVATEPSATTAVAGGFAVEILRDDQVDPNHQIAILLYSENFAKNRSDAARAFMRAYLKGVRFYNEGLKDGRLAGPNADAVIKILTEYTPFKDEKVLRSITPTGIDPDGRVNVASLRKDMEFYQEQGLITNKGADLNEMVDESFLEAALKGLGSKK
jgi:NitT/TauT family transport system substrate-binding protein